MLPFIITLLLMLLLFWEMRCSSFVLACSLQCMSLCDVTEGKGPWCSKSATSNLLRCRCRRVDQSSVLAEKSEPQQSSAEGCLQKAKYGVDCRPRLILDSSLGKKKLWNLIVAVMNYWNLFSDLDVGKAPPPHPRSQQCYDSLNRISPAN